MKLLVEPCMERVVEVEIKGNVFDIQRYSIHDGQGIRTTIFLKGCPLRCKWCSNPESWETQPQLFYSPSRCIQCWLCTSFEGISKGIKGPHIKWNKIQDSDLENIAKVCPSQAMQVKGKLMDVAGVMEVVEKDIPFYKQSNGGITVSGGEPLKQPEFVEALLRACKKKGIHTAIETAGHVNWDNFKRILPCTDHFFFDIKLADSDLHQRFVGKPQDKILENLERLIKSGANLTVRTPVIPGVNDSEDELKAIAQVLKKYGVSSYELLAFHQYGKGKYQSCGMEYELKEMEQMEKERMAGVREFFKKLMG